MGNSIRIAALIIGLFFDILFWDKKPGISIPLYTILWTITAGFFLRQIEPRKKIGNLVLVAIIIVFSMMSSIRVEPLTVTLNSLLILLLAAILTATYQSGLWIRFGVIDYLTQAVRLMGSFLMFPLFSRSSSAKSPEKGKKAKPDILFAVLRGALLAIPILILFTFLLTEADPIFSDFINGLVRNINRTTIKETSLRIILVMFFGNAFIAMVMHAKNQSGDITLFRMDKPLIRPFLGSIETHIILGSVLVLFTAFIGIQFKYFFFGKNNISAVGYTYSAYARRGFGELLAVSVFSLILIFGLGLIRRKDENKSDRLYTFLNIGMVSAVIILLVSAFQRLTLYEQAYGFTRLRLYAHIFMVWLGVLLVFVLVIIIYKKTQLFINLALFVLIGFTMTLNLINVDGTIATMNIRNADVDGCLDSAYLESLSYDAVPSLVGAYMDDSTPPMMKEMVGETIRKFERQLVKWDLQKHSWQSFHFSRWNARKSINQIQ